MFNLNGQIVQIGTGSYLGNYAGPMRTSAVNRYYYSRFAYIFPKSELGNLMHGDTIESLEFFRTDGPAFDTSSRLKMWITTTSRSDFGKNKVSFLSEIANAQQIYNQNPKQHIGTVEAFYKLPFSKKFFYDSTKGENLVLMVEFNQKDTLKGAYNFYFESSSTVSGYAPDQVKFTSGATLADSLNFSTEYHPTIIFNYPRIAKDCDVKGVYTLGKIPLPLGNPDSVKVLLKNVGKNDLKGFKCYTYSIGNNKQKDSFTIDLPRGEQRFFNVPSLNPIKKGTDTIYVSCVDLNTSNNLESSIRLGNENTYSYRDITQSPAPGGIGFSGTQGDFVARFQSNTSKAINQVSVMFSSTGLLFKIGIWSYDSIKARPGKLIYQSDSLKTVNGTYILDLKNPVKVKGSFFVGVRQLDKNNIGFGFQYEDPIRPQTFFFAEPLGDTNWIDFNPGAPYKFIIEPRLQADYDIAAISADYPKDSFNRYVADTMAPIGTVGNIGSYKPKDSINIICEIWGPNSRLYRKVLRDTISPNIKRKYTFPKTFYPTELGEYRLLIISRLVNDQIKDNDTAIRRFYVGLKQDVMVKTMHEPVADFTTYEYLKDTLQPLATIMNMGYDNTPTFNTRCIILKGKNVIYNKINTVALPKFQSKIMYWPTYKCTDTGKLELLIITEMATDKYRYNDTQRRWLIVYKKTDFGLDSLKSPLANGYYDQGVSIPIKFQAYNQGILSLFKIPVIVTVFDPANKVVYFDSVKTDIDGYAVLSIAMPKSLKCFKKGVYKVFITSRGKFDIYPKNDTLISAFNIGLPNDYLPTKILVVDTMSMGTGGYTIGATVKNNGFIKSGNNCPVVCEIEYAGKQVYYAISNVNLDTAAQTSISFFKKFNPMFVGKYKIRIRTNYNGDMNVKNDTIERTFMADIGKDALPMEIIGLKAKYYFGQTLNKLEVAIKNQGRDSLVGVQSKLLIKNKNKVVYASTIFIDTFSPRQAKGRFVNIGLKLNQIGFYEVYLITFHPQDNNVLNDTLINIFEVGIDKDIMLDYVDSPQANKIYQTKQGMYPRVLLRNIGQDSVNSAGNIIYTISNGFPQKVWYRDTVQFTSIVPKDSSWITFKKRVELMDVGVQYVTTYLSSRVDSIAINDTFNCVFAVELNSLNEIRNELLSISPNPVKNRFTIISTSAILNFILYDNLGRKIECKIVDGQLNNSTLECELPKNLSSAVYFLKVMTNKGLLSYPIFVE